MNLVFKSFFILLLKIACAVVADPEKKSKTISFSSDTIEIIYSINNFLEPMKRYPSVFGDRPEIDYKWFEKNYKIREEDFYMFYNLWEWVSKTKTEIRIDNLDFIDKVDNIRSLLENFKSRNELLCQYKIGELNLTI